MILEKPFTKIANRVAYATGTPIAFVICCLVVVVWAVTGPIFDYSDTWQLIINTGTTIVTFLMVFLIQNTQNRDGAAIQAKLERTHPGERGAQLLHRHRTSHGDRGRGIPRQMREGGTGT
ncbi:Low affinity iron permease [Mesorhizobium albiziae]|uniref:Low affinity iron permease n=1 Tax=Neomesorhizobium albiziae TaxID=335020 RepID=A0A1I3VDB2_9HYPH|nr:hypothetical protein GCM10007937_05230 [Mesorhizobium albiziae]SFJ93009.1 Low affinity iron permease [Mesorhizobium albiziae]